MIPTNNQRSLIDLGDGVYTVSEICRILQPTMTPRKAHYWLDTGLLIDPVRRGSRGYPTLLSYRQLLEIRTVQRLRDELEFSLPRVRDALVWVLEHLFAREWTELRFLKGVDGYLVAHSGTDQIVVPGGQGVLEGTLGDLNEQMAETRRAWEEQTFVIPGHRFIVSDARILAGAPTIRGTRIDTALLTRFAASDEFDAGTLADIKHTYPRLTDDAIAEALEFEGFRRAA